MMMTTEDDEAGQIYIRWVTTISDDCRVDNEEEWLDLKSTHQPVVVTETFISEEVVHIADHKTYEVLSVHQG